jgi:hypothetical protein
VSHLQHLPIALALALAIQYLHAYETFAKDRVFDADTSTLLSQSRYQVNLLLIALSKTYCTASKGQPGNLAVFIIEVSLRNA